jgi:glycosyltransferase involved in cell wall biosynthesis
VPDPKALEQRLEDTEPSIPQQQRPVFLYVGRIAQRKGINNLLKACAILQSQGYCHYRLMIVGEGPQREELEGFCKSHNLEDCINWVGWVSYSNLGTYFRNADVFVFPTLEDIWGMVVPEAMAFSKPILCSKEAGAAEMVIEGENGYVFDPHNPEALAEVMRYFIDKPDCIVSMGQKSKQLISQHTPEAAAKLFAEVTSYVLKK